MKKNIFIIVVILVAIVLSFLVWAIFESDFGEEKCAVFNDDKQKCEDSLLCEYKYGQKLPPDAVCNCVECCNDRCDSIFE